MFGGNAPAPASGGGGSSGLVIVGLICIALYVCSSSSAAMTLSFGSPAPQSDMTVPVDTSSATTSAPSSSSETETTETPKPDKDKDKEKEALPADIVNTNVRITNYGRYSKEWNKKNLAVQQACDNKTATNAVENEASNADIWKLVPYKKDYLIVSQRTGCEVRYLGVDTKSNVLIAPKVLTDQGVWLIKQVNTDVMKNKIYIILNKKRTDLKPKVTNALGFPGGDADSTTIMKGPVKDFKTGDIFSQWIIKKAY